MSVLRRRYDVIVVGAGTAGVPLAVRLSEDADRSVLVLEAGPVPDRVDDFPAELLDAGTVQGARPEHPDNWAFAGRLTASREYSIARGRILGGSSTVNGAYFIRARREDFDRWSAHGNDEWGFDRVLPVYRRLETDLDYGASDVHGDSGPMRIRRPPQDHVVTLAFAEAAAELGFAGEPDKNDQAAPGYGPVPMNSVDGIRGNTGMAYLMRTPTRPNLTVEGLSFVRRIVFDGRRAVGVEVEHDGTMSVVTGGEIVLCAGGVKSPHLLLTSGVGPASESERFGIPVVADVPGVGTGFSDHPEVQVGWRPRMDVADYSTTQSMASAMNFTAAGSAGAGDLEILETLKPMAYMLTGRRTEGDTALTFIGAVQAERSRGRIRLQSADPHVQPRIDYRYLSHDADVRRLREVVRTSVQTLRTRAFAGLFDGLTELDEQTIDDDSALDGWIREHIGTAIHLCGSAKFGDPDDPLTVVDQYGRVAGVDGLRVADTSILPDAPSRGPAATAVLIGELVADFMRGTRRQVTANAPGRV